MFKAKAPSTGRFVIVLVGFRFRANFVIENAAGTVVSFRPLPQIGGLFRAFFILRYSGVWVFSRGTPVSPPRLCLWFIYCASILLEGRGCRGDDERDLFGKLFRS